MKQNKQETEKKRTGIVAGKRLLGLLSVVLCVLVISGLSATVFAEGAGSSGIGSTNVVEDVTTESTTDVSYVEPENDEPATDPPV